jgi:phage repressor protein C with HTH and peptisase S24 domain
LRRGAAFKRIAYVALAAVMHPDSAALCGTLQRIHNLCVSHLYNLRKSSGYTNPAPQERYVTCVPLVPLKLAAGAFGEPQHLDDEGFEWTAVETRHHLRLGMFVAQVVGKSMLPAIPDGAYCLFAAPVAGSRQGKTVLVQLRDAADPETGERYTVKRYASQKAKAGDSWQHEKITLKPVNPDFQPIILTDAQAGHVLVIAELVEVLGPV